MVQINLRVDREKKEKWEEFIEETEVSPTISHLIRTSVENRIDTHEEEEKEESPGLSNDVYEIKESIDALQRDVSTLLKHQRDEGDISDLAHEVFDSLQTLPDTFADVPEGSDPKKFRDQEAANLVIDDPVLDDDGPTPQTVSAIADRVGENDSDLIEDALDWLQENFHPVVEVQHEGETHYFKEE